MADDNERHRPFDWSGEEFRALVLALAVLGVLVAATAIFGFGGLITVMLALVFAAFLCLVLISRG